MQIFSKRLLAVVNETELDRKPHVSKDLHSTVSDANREKLARERLKAC